MPDHTQKKTEIFKPIPGYEGYYEVSDRGTVRSVRRIIMRSNGARQTIRERVRKTYQKKSGHLSTSLSKDGEIKAWDIHALVMRAFVSLPPEGMEVRHLDGNPRNNHLSNLRYGSRSENMQDMLRHGTGYEQSKTHCPHGHLYFGANLRRRKRGKGYTARLCVACERAHGRKAVREGKEDFKKVADEIYSTMDVEESLNVSRKGA